MALPINNLRAKYEELSDLFITEVNSRSVVLYYSPQSILTDNVATAGGEPTNFDHYGGRQPLDQFPDRMNESGTQKHIPSNTETITGRTYWNTKKFDKNGNLISDDNTCKIITYVVNESKIINASYATVDGRKIKLLQPPLPYGLFGKQYCISLWQVIE